MIVQFEETFQDKIRGYIEEFEKKSLGYRLPEVNYLETHTTSKQKFRPKFSISLPVKNRESDISAVLDVLVSVVQDPAELFILLDNCEDQSEKEVRTWLSKMKQNGEVPIAIHLMSSSKDLFESTCENIVFRLSLGAYLVSTQADIYLEDESFLSRSASVLEKYGDVFAVSGRAVVNEARTKWSRSRHVLSLLSRIRLPSPLEMQKDLRLGAYFPGLKVYGDRSSQPTSKMHFTSKQLRSLFIGPSVLRGPIVWRAEVFRQMGGFRDECFFLGRDEMDLCQRAHQELGLYVGFMPSTSFSFLWQGTSHKERSLIAEAEMNNRSKLSKQLCPEYFKPSKNFNYPKDYQRSF